jgi:hypothetical protein
MPQNNKTKDTGNRQDQTRGSGSNESERFKKISKGSSQVVKDAAALLDEELAAGILAAKQVQQRFQKDRRIDPGDFKKALDKFQGDAHEVVTLLDNQISELSSQDSKDLSKRFLHNAHDVVDLAVELVTLGAQIADQMTKSNFKRDAKNRAKRSR